MPACEHEIISKANWPLFKETIKSKIAPINHNNKEIELINTSLDKIEKAVNEAQNTAIPKLRLNILPGLMKHPSSSDLGKYYLKFID